METKSEEICQAVEENPENNSQEAPIFKLNDDCLINIFKFLPIKDRIGLEKGINFYFTISLLHYCIRYFLYSKVTRVTIVNYCKRGKK